MPIQFNVDAAQLALLGVLLAVSCVYFWWMARRTLTDMSPGRRRLSLGFRLAIVVLLFLALAQTRWVRRNDRLAVIFLVDSSRSIREDQKQVAAVFIRQALKEKRPGDRAGIVTFGEDPHIKALPAAELEAGEIAHTGAANASNIAQALDAALSVLPRDSGGKVVVLSDGNENVGSALAHVPSLAARGVKVDTVLLPSTLKKEALVEKLILPARVKIGEPFSARVITRALNSQAGRITLRRDGVPVGPGRAIDIAEGRRVHDFEVRIEKPGFYRFEALLETDAQADTLPENNRGLGFVAVRGKPQALYVAQDPRLMRFLKSALDRQNIDVHYVPPEAMPTTAAALQQFDTVILSDVNRDSFSAAQLKAMQVATRDFGVGFGMIGGEESFGLGGYRKTPVEEILPVSLDIRKMQRFPPVTVALVIDRSGSMEESGSGGRKLDLAKEGAARAVDYLKPGDKVTVVTFTFGGEVQVPLMGVEQADEIKAGIGAIGSGGGTSVYSGVDTAFQVIKDDPSPIKHMIVLTDGVSNDPDYGPLIAEMKKRKITVTGVLIGAGTGSTNPGVLAYLAQQTGGRFHSVDNPAELPRIYLQEIERISSRPIVEEPFTPQAMAGAQDQLPGVPWSAMPPLLGYNVTELKPTADLLLRSHRNEPVLATWRYGLGRSLAFTSDDRNKWAVHWLPWSGYGQFWAQAVRWTMRSFAQSDFQTQVTMEGTRARIAVDALDSEGRFLNRLQFRARVSTPDMDSPSLPEIPLRQTGPGHYEGWFDAARIGTYLVNVIRDRPDGKVESTVSGLVVPYSPEFKDLEANAYLMNQLARVGGGDTITTASRVFGANRPVVFAAVDLYPFLLILAMLLFPLDVAVRRLMVGREDFARAREWIRSRSRRRPVGDAATPQLARLKTVKQRALATATAGPVEAAQRPAASPERPPASAAANPGPDSQPPESRRQPPAGPEPPLSAMDRLKAAKRRAQEQRDSES